jgi:nucleoside-diphosphate-sugar epimerase
MRVVLTGAAMPIETLRVNAEGTHHLLRRACQKGAKFFYASTSEVYGDPLIHRQNETYWGHVNSVGPRSVYDEVGTTAKPWCARCTAATNCPLA